MKDFHVRRRTPWMVMSLILTVAGCGGDSGTNGGGGNGGGGGTTPVITTSVNVVDFAFAPPDIQVTGGAMVTWTWTGSIVHNVTFASTSIANSVTQSSGIYKTRVPIVIGVYTYQCTIHPDEMNGTVTVRDLEG